MRYKLLIVDDEAIIADGLMSLFQDHEDLKLDVYTSYSAPEALDFMKNTKIDIVLTDLCMPVLNGIKFHEKIKSHWPECKVIYLTGHDDFEYVQAAIRNESVDFVLKTEDDKKIVSSVKKALCKIEHEIEQKDIVENAKKQMQQALPILKRDYLLSLTEGLNTSFDERQQQFNELDISLDCSLPVLLLLGKIDDWPENLGFTQKKVLLFEMQDLVHEFLKPKTEEISVSFQHNSLLWFIQPLKQAVDISWNDCFHFIRGTLDSIQDAIKRLLNIRISFILSSDPVSWEALDEGLHYLLFDFRRAAGLNSEVVMVSDNSVLSKSNEVGVKNFKKTLQVRLQLKKIGLLDVMLENGQKNEFRETLMSIMENIQEQGAISYIIEREVYYSISLLFLAYLNKLVSMMDNINIYEDIIKEIMKIGDNKSWGEITNHLWRLAEMIFELQSDEYNSSTVRIIKKINGYIDENVGSDLSLNNLSERFNFNPSYLSRLYKQTTGVGLFEYVTQIKLHYAKQMLKETDKKNYDIAEALGFGSASYFNHFFKKYTNLSPQEYRDKIV